MPRATARPAADARTSRPRPAGLRPAAPLGPRAAAAAGARFTCVLTADGDVVCAGDASLDQAALPLRPSGTGFSR
ncbi:MAG: hypothetical protein ACO3O6_11410, partial [Gemmobacter sp.]